MSSLEDKLLKLKEILEKGMKNGGIGGPGAVKIKGAILPSINNLVPKVGNNSATPSIGISQESKKNPIKQAQQTQNKDIKDIKMKEAQATLALKKDEVAPDGSNNRETYEKEFVKFDDNGQWSLDKSGYKGYSPEDNARRKANNLSESTGINSMNRIKQYGGSGPNAASREAAKMKAKSKKNPVKIFTPEEISQENQKRNLDKGEDYIVKFDDNGQWSMEKRCWEGYEPTPGKKAYEDDSCRPAKKADIEVAPEGSKNRESYKNQFEKKEEKPFHGYSKEKHSKEGGMSSQAREKYNKETGSNLQKPVTSNEAQNSDKKASRRKSFCARMGGVKGPTSKDGKLTRKGAALKRWDC